MKVCLWREIAKSPDTFFKRIRIGVLDGNGQFMDTESMMKSFGNENYNRDIDIRSLLKSTFLDAHFFKFDDDLAYHDNDKNCSVTTSFPESSRIVLPFKTVWIEHDDKHIMSCRPMNDSKNEFHISAMLISYYNDKVILAYQFCMSDILQTMFITPTMLPLVPINAGVPIHPSVELSNIIASHFVSLLQSPKVGIVSEPTFKKIRTKESGKKAARLVKEVITVLPKKKAKGLFGTRNIEWSHIWEVMGHWRRVPGEGKDRFGVYCVNGLTWVDSHKKGVGEFVKKQRTYVPDAQQTSH